MQINASDTGRAELRSTENIYAQQKTFCNVGVKGNVLKICVILRPTKSLYSRSYVIRHNKIIID